MSWHHEIITRVKALLGRARDEREMQEELGFHIEMETRKNIEEGLDPAEARRRAVRAFGSADRYKEEVRDERGARWFDDAGQDVRFAWRSLLRRPAFTVIAALTLALGIAATTTLFGVVKSVLLTPLPYGRPEGIAVIWSAWKDFPQTWLSYDEYEAWKSEIPAFANVGLYGDASVTLTGGTGEPERLRAGQVDRNVFSILGVSPILGRGFTAEEDRPNGPSVIVLGYDVWQRRYGGDPSIVGRAIEVGGQATTVVGVMPSGFRLPLDFGAAGKSEAWVPVATDAPSEGAVTGPAFSRGGGNHGYYGVARLARGATIEQANSQLRAFVADLVRQGVYPQTMQFRAFTKSVEDQVTGRVRPALLVVFGAVGLVLLIACANVAGLLLVRGESRRRELAVRVALGAGGRRLSRLLLTESLVLAGIGGSFGIALAVGGVWVVRHTAPANLPRIGDTHLDLVVLLFAVGVAALTALLSGVLPALQAAHVAPAVELKEGGRANSAGPGGIRWRQTLVVAEVALAVVLVAAAGLMIRSVANLFSIEKGFRTESVLTMRLSTPSAWYPDSVRVEAFYTELQRRLRAIPQVDAVGAVRNLPLSTEMGDWGLVVEGYTPPPNQGTPGDWQVVTPGYFQAMGLRLVSGRFFDERDAMSGPRAMIINRAFAEKYLAGRAPLGARVRVQSGQPDSGWSSVVGVVENVRHNSLLADVKPQFYATLGQFARIPGSTSRSMSLVVHTSGDPNTLVAPVRATIHAIDPRLPVSQIRTMDQVLGESIAEPRFAMQLLGIFGALALTLSAIGIFGIVSQVVASRTHEFGIRSALGAAPRQLVMLSVRAGVRQAGAGLIIGVAIALLLTRTLAALLHGVAPTDPATFAVVVVVTGAVAVVASAWPARRAGRTDPAAVLHDG